MPTEKTELGKEKKKERKTKQKQKRKQKPKKKKKPDNQENKKKTEKKKKMRTDYKKATPNPTNKTAVKNKGKQTTEMMTRKIECSTLSPDADIRLAKYCMQQLLLSQAALETLATKHEQFLTKVSVRAKEELLSQFDYNHDQFAEFLWDTGRDATLASIFGFLWGPTRQVWAFVTKKKKKKNRKKNK